MQCIFSDITETLFFLVVVMMPDLVYKWSVMALHLTPMNAGGHAEPCDISTLTLQTALLIGHAARIVEAHFKVR